jgi:hypothetical protein
LTTAKPKPRISVLDRNSKRKSTSTIDIHHMM